MTYGQGRVANSPLTLTLKELRSKFGNLNELSIAEIRAARCANDRTPDSIGSEEKENGIRSNCEGLATAERACGINE